MYSDTYYYCILDLITSMHLALRYYCKRPYIFQEIKSFEKRKLKMFKVILFSTILCLHWKYTQQVSVKKEVKIEVSLAVRDLVESFLVAIAPETLEKCPNGDLKVNLHQMDKNGKIIQTIRAHKEQMITKGSSKIAMILPSFNDNIKWKVIRKAAAALVKKASDIDVYLVESKRVSF